VLKWDMTALYGVRHVLEVEKIFLYLCYHDGGILDVPTLSRELDGINRQSVNNFLDLFEATNLVYRLRPFGYGKEVLRGRSKLYLADAALPGSVLLLGRRLLENADRLGAAVETAFFKHLFTRYYADQPTFSYWQDKKNRDLEVDIVAETGGRLVPFEVKYQDTEITMKKLKGLRLFLEEHGVQKAYVVTRAGKTSAHANLPRLNAEKNANYSMRRSFPFPRPWPAFGCPSERFFDPRIQEVAECLNGRFRWSFDAKSILDLTAPSTRAHFGLKDSDFSRSYVTRSGELIPLQKIGQAVSRQRKITAIRYPSRTMRNARKLDTTSWSFRTSSPEAISSRS